MVLKLIISLLLISQALGKCDLNAIFQTPDNRNLDQFEILERSNFKDGDEEPVAPSSDASPKSYANAQVSLRFGGGALPELYNHKQRSAIDYQTQYLPPYFGHPQSYHHYQPYPYPPNYYYPPPTYGPYLPPPAKVVEELVTDETAADKEITHFENVKHPEILKTVVLSNEEVGANERIVDIANSNVKFLNLDVEDVTSEERKADIGKLLTKALVPVNCFKCDQKRKLLVSYPIVREDDKEEYAPSPIMVGEDEEQQVSDCGCGERHPELPIGKRFNVDMDDLTNINGVPIELPAKHLKPQYLPAPIPFRGPYPATYPAPAPVTYPSAPLTNFAPKYYQPSYLRPFVPPTKVVAPPCAGYPKQYYGSGYSYSSGANYYSDPRQAVYYQHPTVVSMYNSQTVPFKRFEAVPKYNVLPKYDILPKYDVVPLANDALINALRKVNEQEKRRHGADCGCSSCAKYTGELTY